jgi:hypothetical protein
MKNEERAHLEAHYQNELEFMKNEVAQMTQMTSLLKQLLRAKNREGTSAQPPIETPAVHAPHTSWNLGTN